MLAKRTARDEGVAIAMQGSFIQGIFWPAFMVYEVFAALGG